MTYTVEEILFIGNSNEHETSISAIYCTLYLYVCAKTYAYEVQ